MGWGWPIRGWGWDWGLDGKRSDGMTTSSGRGIKDSFCRFIHFKTVSFKTPATSALREKLSKIKKSLK